MKRTTGTAVQSTAWLRWRVGSGRSAAARGATGGRHRVSPAIGCPGDGLGPPATDAPIGCQDPVSTR
jgi:hypothetical protein